MIALDLVSGTRKSVSGGVTRTVMSVEGPTPVFGTGHSQATSDPDLDIVFVHGLSGDRRATWTATDGAFWPQWLADQFPRANVYLAGYDSHVFAGLLLGSGASIQDIASTLADGLISRPTQAGRLVLITHSLGGLIVKQMIRKCQDSADPRFKALLDKIGAVVFLGTPHQGAEFANALDTLLHSFKSKFTKQLAYSSDALIDLNAFFCNVAVERKITVRTFYETEKTNGIHVVNRVTANPGVYGTEPIAVQANHIEICKLVSKNSPVFQSVCELLRAFDISGSSRALVPASPGTALVSSPLRTELLGRTAPSVPSTDLATFQPASVALECDPPMGLPPEILDDYAYFTTVAADDRRDIEKKLVDAGRGYQINDAKKRKERFAMALRRHIAQPAAVTRYTQILADVESRYARHVARVLSAGATTALVDHAIQQDVIDPCVARFSSDGNEITSSLVDNALYYLAGNCHVSWDND